MRSLFGQNYPDLLRLRLNKREDRRLQTGDQARMNRRIRRLSLSCHQGKAPSGP
jgi:hypothetical protein